MESYQTANLYEISILLASGKKFSSINRDDIQKVTFIFPNISECQNILTAYYNKEKLVSPFDFVQAIKEAKQIIYNYNKK